MAVPDFQSIMRPLLVALEDGEPHSIRSVRDTLAQELSLTQSDLDERIPSGRVTTFQNRVGWATTYLFRCRLLERPERSIYQISERGRDVLGSHPERVDLKTLAQFEEFNEFRQTKGPASDVSDVGVKQQTPPEAETETPEVQIDAAYRELRSALSADVLDRVFEKSPDFFEQLVLDVLHAMGYGGRRDDAGMRLGKSGDEGVDGVIREDELGLDLIYLQAKRWANPVGRPEIQKFFGALHGQRATKGVFITTSTFTSEAVAYANQVTPRVILVDGKELARLMIDHEVGVAVARTYKLKRVDLDYFAVDDEDPVGQPDPSPT